MTIALVIIFFGVMLFALVIVVQYWRLLHEFRATQYRLADERLYRFDLEDKFERLCKLYSPEREKYRAAFGYDPIDKAIEASRSADGQAGPSLPTFFDASRADEVHRARLKVQAADEES